ncbi:hypothetical protein [Brumimicrobium oceani]|uniref:Uncharacterized protein n=1 Tax=Brumimicrobium oceani TaxID=2100725 RepID=A0A2U2XBQ7_9FLAO|nr:hypothetical protein [Brumimicrobium oceani]PWH85234.1 hypothetical protein DIT68_09860 [Brumimicrobium oceani]
MIRSVLSFISIILILVLSSNTYAQNQDSTFFQKTSTRIIESFHKSINHSKLKEDGLIVKDILTCEISSEYAEQINLPWYDSRKLKDSIVSIQEKDDEIIVQFIIHEISYPIISWQTNIEINDHNTLSLICFPIAEAMGHYPRYTPICISIHFEKVKEVELKSVTLNKRNKYDGYFGK